MKTWKHWAGGLAAVGGAVWPAAPVSAEDTDAVQEVVVTARHGAGDNASATKSTAPLIETPQSVSVISADQIDLQAARSLGEALRYTAGLVSEQYGGVDQRIDWFVLRGFQTSTVYVDGLTTNSRYTLLSPKVDPWGLDRIEVLRGPSSVLYGQNVPGGLVNVISKRPQATAGGEIDLVTGSYGRAEARVDMTGPLDADRSLLYRVTASALDTGTQVDHVRNHHDYLAPSLTWRPDDRTSVTFLSHFLRQDDGFALQNLPAAGTLLPSPLGKVSTSLFTGEPSLNKATLDQWDAGYDARHTLASGWSLQQNLRYAHSNVGLGYVGGYGQEEDAPQLMDRFALDAIAHQNNLSVDTRLEGSVTTGALKHALLFGIDFSRSHDFWSEQDGDAAPLDITRPVYGGPISLTLDYVTDDTLSQTGLYAQDQVRLDRLVLTGSVREDFAHTRTEDALAGSALDQHDRAFTGRAGAVYELDGGFAPYASVSTSFQPTIGTTFDVTPLRPTTARQWEGGLKYQPRGGGRSALLSVYQIDERNVTTADPDADHPNQVVQTGGARVRGVELSGDLDVGKGFTTTFAYTFLDSRITSANDDTLGKRLMDVARHSGSAWLDKVVALEGGDRLTLGLGARYTGARFGDNENTLRLPGDTQLDAMLRYERAHWRLSLNARNLADRTIVAQCDSTARCFYQERRSILAAAGYTW